MKKQLWGRVSAAVLFVTAVPVVSAAGEESVSAPCKGKTPDGSYDYEVTNDGNVGTIAFEGASLSGGAFSCKWDDIHDCTFSKGHHIAENKKSYAEFGGIECDYAMEYTPEGVSQYGIHGWVESKNSFDCGFAEFTIVEGYHEWRPCSDSSRDTKLLSQATIDGCTYDLYEIVHYASLDAPMSRNQVFYQYLSVITEECNSVQSTGTSSVSHKVNISEHFKAWENVGIDLSGALYEVSFWIVGFDSSGEAAVTKNVITLGNEKGDVNGDGARDHADVRLLQTVLTNQTAAPENWQSADLSGDGFLNAADLSLLKRDLLDH